MGLSRLTIKNIVLIESLTIDFSDGLGALTGETGAGKSILLDSLGLALGARSESRLVRSGADKASVTAEFDIPADHAVYALINDQDLDLDIHAGEPLILRRSLTADGRSRAYINDESISVKTLQIIGQTLVEIHGQYDTHGLLDPSTHSALLDQYAAIKTDMPALWQDYKTQHKLFENMQNDIAQAQQDEDFLRDAIKDIDTLAPEHGEEDQLAALRDQLIHRERVLEGLNTAYAALTDDNDPINTALGAIDRIADKMGARSDDLINALERARYEIDDVCATLQSISADLNDSEHNLETIDERLYALRKEARKHQCSVDDLIHKREELAEKLNAIEYAEDHLNDQRHKMEQAFAAFKAAAQEVSTQRKAAAATLDNKVIAELEPLKLGRAQFITDVSALPESQWGPSGMDAVQFLVATNTGQAAGPLGKIASGGEMSRFMLALKVVMAAGGSGAGTLIFDEVDAGIGGSTADAVGQRLARLGDNHQVLVVTHAPQVAARAAHHYIVQKSSDDITTHTDIRTLSTATEREDEIARMLAGETITSEAKAAAQALLKNAHQEAA